MKTIKTLAFAAAALFVVASCEKSAPVSDAVVGFESDAYEFTLEAGPNFEIPISVSGSNIAYPFTITVNSLPETEENGYSERNVDYRFIERDIVVESAEDKPVVVVRLINDDIESFLMGIEIKSVSNGTVGAASKVEVAADFGLLKSQGVYQAVGTKSGVEYTENWTFITEGADFVGFWGLLGMADMEEYWPIMGDAVYDLESDASLMSFDFTVDNYITEGAFRNADGSTYNALIAPILYDGMYVYTSETVQMLCDGETLKLGLPEGVMITYGLFSPETGGFLGKVFGGFLAINDWTLSRVGNVIIENSAAQTAGADLVTLIDVESKEASKYYVTYEKGSERKSFNK